MKAIKNIVSVFSFLILFFISGSLILSQIFAFSYSTAEAASHVVHLDSNATAVDQGSGGVSSNWAGYAATGGQYSAVSGSWIVPQAQNPNTALGSDATWIGIGGLRSHDLIQMGTLAMTSNQGQVSYEAWIERLPNTPQELPITVHPGDSVSASLHQVGDNVWQISFVNNTTGKQYSTNVTYSSSLSSAEWVEEMPSDATSASFIPLDNFGSVQFTNTYTTKNGVNMTAAEANAQSITMINSNHEALAVANNLDTSGSSFAVSRTSVTSDTPEDQIAQVVQQNVPGQAIAIPFGSGTLVITIGSDGISVQQAVNQSTNVPARAFAHHVHRYYRM